MEDEKEEIGESKGESWQRGMEAGLRCVSTRVPDAFFSAGRELGFFFFVEEEKKNTYRPG